MPKEKTEAFEEAARPLVKWLAQNVHPHHYALVGPTGAQLWEAQINVPIRDYIQD